MTNEIDFEVMFEVMNEVREELCSKCQDRYWERCGGIYAFMKDIIACRKAKESYQRKIREKQ